MKYLYKYPHAPFPYSQLLEENRHRGKNEPEFELLDTGVFDEDRYFDIFVEYAKGDVEDIFIKISVSNRGPETARLRLLPTIWFRNTWGGDSTRPVMRQVAGAIELNHPSSGKRWLYCEGFPELLFTENETNFKRLFGVGNRSKCVKDGINDYILHGVKEAVAAESSGTKAAAHYQLEIGAGETAIVRLRFSDIDFSGVAEAAFEGFDDLLSTRKTEADAFYATGSLLRRAKCHAPGICRHAVVQTVLSLRD
jgi:hypothetical protein